MERQKKKFEKLWLKKTGDCSNIQNGGDGKIQISNGTVKPIQTTTNTAETAKTSVNNNNKGKWVHNLSKTPLTVAQEKY